MSIKTAKKEIRSLQTYLKECSVAYHEKSEPLISDAEYDSKMQKLKKLESAYPDLKGINSITDQVGAPISDVFQSEKHLAPMLSLSNVFSKEDFEKFNESVKKLLELDNDEDVEYVCERKFDGVAISIVYENGKLVRAVTRGDGKVGENVTHNVLTMACIPQTLYMAVSGTLEVRGEIFIDKKSFKKMNQQTTKKYVNARNAASGSLRLLDAEETAQRPLRAFIYGIGKMDNLILTKQSQILSYLETLGLPVDSYSKKVSDNKVMDMYDKMVNDRASMEVEIDGMVLKVNRLDYQQKLGMRTNNPRWATAFKFPAEIASTRIKKVEFQVGRTGVLTPVAILEPVFVGGATVTRATLHNMDEISNKNVRVGDMVDVRRAGDVIPEIVGQSESNVRATSAPPIEMPETCPSCSSQVAQTVGQSAYRCTGGFRCQAQLAERLKHFISRDAFDIKNLGSTVIDQLVEKEMIASPSHLWQLKKEEWMSLDKVGERKAEIIMEAIEKAREVTLDKFIYSLGIPEIGRSASRDLANKSGSISGLHKLTSEEIEKIEGFGPTMVKNLETWSQDEDNTLEFSMLALICNIINPDKKQHVSGNDLSQENIVITGSFSQYDRSALSEQIRSLGGKISSSVSKKTTLLIAGEKAGSKLAKAESLGTKVIGEEEIKAFIG